MNQIIPIDNPFIAATRNELATTEDAKQEILDRKRRRMEFWMNTMDDTTEKKMGGPSFADRLRASELAAKADGDFLDEKQKVPQLISYRELLMTRVGTFVEVAPQHETAMSDADAAEVIIEPEYAIEGFE